MKNILYMNNEIQSWKCPNCDTLNSGKRCLVCGGEKSSVPEIKSTMSAPKKSTADKKLIIALCSIIAVLTIGIIVLCVAWLTDGNSTETQTPVNSHEIKLGSETVKKEDKAKEDKYISDPVYSVKFNLSVDKQKIEKNPEYEKKSNEEMTYIVPNHFRTSDNSRYFPRDNTAYIRFMKESVTDAVSVDLMASKKSQLGGNISLERAEDTRYFLSTLRNGIVYYTKGIICEDGVISFMFVYPEEYRDIYDDYVKDIADGFELPDTSGIEIIEE